MKLIKTEIDPRETEPGQVVEFSISARSYVRAYPLREHTGKVVKVTREAVYLNPHFLAPASKEATYFPYQMSGDSPFMQARFAYDSIVESNLVKLDVEVPRLIHPDELAPLRDYLEGDEMARRELVDRVLNRLRGQSEYTQEVRGEELKFRDDIAGLLYEIVPILKPKGERR